MTTVNEIEPYDQYDSSFINKLLGEMKSKFNNSEDEHQIEGLNVDSKSSNTNDNLEKVSDSEEVNKFIKPSFESPSKSSKDISPGKRSTKQKSSVPEEKSYDNLKRSSRRRNKESVLQSAIARKKKSYNEATKPQRLSRQLRPTLKVLENIAQAKEVKKVKIKTREKSSDLESSTDEYSRKNKGNSRKKQRSIKRLKNNDSDRESSDNYSSDDDVDYAGVKNIRKSRRILLSQSKDQDSSSTSPKDQVEEVPFQIDGDGDESLEVTCRLCLCIQNSNFYSLPNNEDIVYCSAVDSISERLVGCTREVNIQITPLLRPSRRVPYMSLCELHKNRLIRHNCCPTCGIFCTQGTFLQCEAGHQYHQKCYLTMDNTQCCPHCGVSAPSRSITLKFQCSNTPVFLPVQKPERQAKMVFSKACDQIRCSTPLLLPTDSYKNFNDALTSQKFTQNDILNAISDDDVEKLTIIIISNSLDLQFKLAEFNEGTLLHYAAYKGLLEICHLLISLGFQINDIDKEQNTPIMLAITAHNLDVVRYLVRAGANIFLKGTDGMSALHVSSKCGNLQACKILLKAGATDRNYVNCQDDGGWTPLVWACENGFSEIADFLIIKGADPKLRDVEHNEALHWAAFSGCTHILELLLNLDGDVNTTNAHGETPLHIAAREDRYNCVIMLLARGANCFLLNKNNEAPLNCVPEDGISYNIISLNMRLQSMVDSEPRKYKTILSDDISKGRESNPVQCVNTVDEDLEPKNFVYITKSVVVSEGFNIEKKLNSLHTCKCEERCTSQECLCGRLSVSCWYDEEGKLKIDFNFSDAPMIFECSDMCLCNAITCRNRVIQKGSQQRFQLYKTESKGWGLRTLNFISKGCYVCEYVGEILTDNDADQREDDSFLFDIGLRNGDGFCVDAQFYGNLTRFINHSCSPNLQPIKVFVDHQDLRFPRIAFFALKDISIGDELSFDYGFKFWLAKYKNFTCQCGSNECKYSEESVKVTFAEEEETDE